MRKLTLRAHIGYLVGYKSSNIFYIWVPAKQQVISSRDVNFDEMRLYNLTKPILLSQLQEKVDYTQEVIKFPQQTEELSGLSINSDSDTNETETEADEIQPEQTELLDKLST